MWKYSFWLTISFLNSNSKVTLQIIKTNKNMNRKPTKLYTLVFTEEQLAALSLSYCHLNRMDCLMSLIRSSVTEPCEYSKRHFTTMLQVGQVALSEVELAFLWNCNRKTASKIIDIFNTIGVITSVQSNRTSVHSIHCIHHFTIGEETVPNPFSKGP